MKIGILTASRTDNIGTDLQTACMLILFKRYFENVVIINYECSRIESGKRIFQMDNARKFLLIPFLVINNIQHRIFRRKYLVRSRVINPTSTLESLDLQAVIIGSDQIWNLSITGGDLNYFLPSNFYNGPKFSYSASIGYLDFSSWKEEPIVIEYLRDFSLIGIRETYSSLQLNQRYHLNTIATLDPIIFVGVKYFYRELERREKKKYIVIYRFGESNAIVDFAMKLSKKTGLSIVYQGISKPRKNMKMVYTPTISKWLKIISNAELVLTDSYQCLAVCIAMNKDFYVFTLNDFHKDLRAKSLLDDLEITHRFVENQPQSDIIDWGKVNNNVNKLKYKSELYIESIRRVMGGNL